MGLLHNERTLKTRLSSLRRQDVLCLLLYHLGASRIRNLLFRLRGIPVTRILAFHDLPDYLAANFREQMKLLKRQANVISLADFFAGRVCQKKINVVITFDDGYRGWIDNALPALKELSLNATFFVSSGFVDLGGEDEQRYIRDNLKSDARTTGSLPSHGLRILAAEGFGVGGHTWNHIDFEKATERHVYDELKHDKENLASITGTQVDHFAYPFGIHRHAHIDLAQILRVVGYQGAVTTRPGFNSAQTNPFFLHRDLVNPALSLSVFKARFLGTSDGVVAVRKAMGL